jgi:hypothetical protein
MPSNAERARAIDGPSAMSMTPVAGQRQYTALPVGSPAMRLREFVQRVFPAQWEGMVNFCEGRESAALYGVNMPFPSDDLPADELLGEVQKFTLGREIVRLVREALVSGRYDVTAVDPEGAYRVVSRSDLLGLSPLIWTNQLQATGGLQFSEVQISVSENAEALERAAALEEWLLQEKLRNPNANPKREALQHDAKQTIPGLTDLEFAVGYRNIFQRSRGRPKLPNSNETNPRVNG